MQTPQSIQSILGLHLLPLLQTLPVSPTSWLPVAFIAVLIVILVSAIIYMLSNVIGSQNAKAWSRLQIYEALFSLLLLLAFSSLAYIFFLNPQTVLGAVKLVPTGCTGATQLFTLSTCDLSQFDTSVFAIAKYSFIALYVQQLPQPPKFTFYPLPEDTGVSLQISIPGILPDGTTSILKYFYEIVVFALIFNQLQLITLSGAVLFLSVFLSIGLIARTFGFSRTFGGAMIAFGLGIGILYPLMVSITYGFIDVNSGLMCLQTLSGAASCASSYLNILVSVIISPTTLTTTLGTAFGTLMSQIGYVIAGLTLIPLLNIAIVDAFIIDFSSAIGERMSFGTIFSNFL